MDTEGYSPLIVELLAEPRLMVLGPGSPNRAMRDRLQVLSVEKLFSTVKDRDMAQACLAGLWLYHDFLDESHRISQDLSSVEGSYWHAIMHRREPDASNSKYWWRRVGEHPIFEALAQAAESEGLRLGSGRWDPYGFVDLCEKHRGTDSEQETLLRRLQQREWELLFDWCFRHARG